MGRIREMFLGGRQDAEPEQGMDPAHALQQAAQAHQQPGAEFEYVRHEDQGIAAARSAGLGIPLYLEGQEKSRDELVNRVRLPVEAHLGRFALDAPPVQKNLDRSYTAMERWLADQKEKKNDLAVRILMHPVRGKNLLEFYDILLEVHDRFYNTTKKGHQVIQQQGRLLEVEIGEIANLVGQQQHLRAEQSDTETFLTRQHIGIKQTQEALMDAMKAHKRAEGEYEAQLKRQQEQDEINEAATAGTAADFREWEENPSADVQDRILRSALDMGGSPGTRSIIVPFDGRSETQQVVAEYTGNLEFLQGRAEKYGAERSERERALTELKARYSEKSEKMTKIRQAIFDLAFTAVNLEQFSQNHLVPLYQYVIGEAEAHGQEGIAIINDARMLQRELDSRTGEVPNLTELVKFNFGQDDEAQVVIARVRALTKAAQAKVKEVSANSGPVATEKDVDMSKPLITQFQQARA